MRAQRKRDLALLTADRETGWWDEHRTPAPWPHDFFDPDTDPPKLAPGEQPF